MEGGGRRCACTCSLYVAGLEDGVWIVAPVIMIHISYSSSASPAMLCLPSNWTEDQCCLGDGGGRVRRNQSWPVQKDREMLESLKGEGNSIQSAVVA